MVPARRWMASTRGGYRLAYTDTMSDYQKTLYGEHGRNDFVYSLGFVTSSHKHDRQRPVEQPGLPAGPGGRHADHRRQRRGGVAFQLAAAVTAAKGTDAPIELIVKDGDRFRTVAFDYHDGLKYPHLERIAGTPDRLGDMFTARRR